MDRMHVVVHTIPETLLVSWKRTFHCLSIDNKVESGNKDQDEESWEAVAPDVDTLVMHHEETPNNFPGSIEVDPVSMSDVTIVLNEPGSILESSNEMFLIILFLFFRLLILFFLLLLLL